MNIFRLLRYPLLAFVAISNVSAADTELRRCVIDGKTVYQGGVCPGQVDENARRVWNEQRLERERKIEESRRLEARLREQKTDTVEPERRKEQASKSASESSVVDCTNLYLWGKNARGDSDWVVRDTVRNARAKGLCR